MATISDVDKVSATLPDSAENNEKLTGAKSTTNGAPHDGDGGEQLSESVFQLNVILPHDPKSIQITVSSQEAIHDVRQTIIELPGTYQYSCFHLEHNGFRINDFVQISEINGLMAGSEVTLVEDPYTEKDARMHFVRVRELIGAAGNRSDVVSGILPGMSLHDSVTACEASRDGDAQGGPHALTGYDLQACGQLAILLPQQHAAPPKTVKSISVSPWNPPPPHWRQLGHLLYLQIITNEGEQHQITSHVSGFFVNKSSSTKFDPLSRTTPKGYAAHSLLTLISLLSPSFDALFKGLQEFNNVKEPLSTFQITNTSPSAPWVVPSPLSPLTEHQPDITRTQESYLISGVENTETLRDWNEEFQSTRELPKETVQDRVFRERLTSKLFADYTDAAARGAVLVARGEVAPLNPTEGRDAQIFVYNNVFFSFGADGVGTFASEGGDEAARVATGKDVLGVRIVNQLDIDGLFTPGTVVVDYLGKRIVGQSIVPGIFKQREPGENQIDYGAVDGRDVIAADDRFLPVFQVLSKALKVKKHAVWDKEGKRFDLEGSIETKGLLGTDGRKYVLDLYRITPLDIAWMEECGTAVETIAAKIKTPSLYPHRMTVLRPELVESYHKAKMREWVNEELIKRRQITGQVGTSTSPTSSEPRNAISPDVSSSSNNAVERYDADPLASVEGNQERINMSEFSFALNPDTFSGQEPRSDSEKQEMAKDERDVRLACEYLRSKVLPELLHDLQEGEVGFPMDGQSLTRLLHKRGINVRYLGKLAELAEGKRLESLRALAIQEMVARAFKHVGGKYLRHLPIPLTPCCISHLLNCLLGSILNPNPKPDVDEGLCTLFPGADLAFQEVSPHSLVEEIRTEIFRRYQYNIDGRWSQNLKCTQLLREISLKTGLQLEVREYHFMAQPSNHGTDSPLPDGGLAKETITASQSSKKKKKNGDSPLTSTTSKKAQRPSAFYPSDILNIVPIIKEASPRSSLAEEALEAGRISIMQNQKKLGQELLLESLSLHEQIYGIIHPEVARVYNTLSMLYYQLDEKDAAVELARKAVIVSERTLGVDNAETLLSYLNLGLFDHASGNTRQALGYVKHALELWKIIYGPNHPDSITTINNAAVMLQHLKDYHESRMWFEASLRICEGVYGKQSINAATLLFQLAQALALDQDSKGAVNRMRESYNIFLAELGANDKNTKEAESWLEQLTQNAVSIAKHAKDVQARRIRAGIRVSPRVTLGQTHPQPQVGQTVEATSGRDPNNSMGLDSRSIDELIKFIEGTDQKPSSKKRPGRSNPRRRGGNGVLA